MRFPSTLLAVLLVMPAPLAVGQASPPPAFLASDLPPGRLTAVRADTAGNVSAVGNAADGYGCGAAVTRNGYYLGIDGRIMPLCPLTGDLQSTASGFAVVNNDVTLVVGRTIDAAQHERPAVWMRTYNGSFTGAALPLPIASPQGFAVAIDSFGRITGDLENGGHRVPAYWPDRGTLPTLFPTDGVGQGRVIRDFSGEPVIAGVFNNHAMVWYPKRSQDDAVRYPLGATTLTDARALRNLGGVAAIGGSVTRTDGTPAPVMFTGTSTVSLPLLADGFGQVFDMRPGLTEAVGNARAADGSQHAVLWRAGGVLDLNDLLLPVCRGNVDELCAVRTLTNANAITNSGAIAAQAMQSGVLHGVLLQPVGPFTWALDSCASVVTSGPGCSVNVANPRFASTSQFATEATFPATKVVGGDQASSVAQPRTAQASASAVRNAAQSDAIFQNFIVFDSLSVSPARLLRPGERTIVMYFHFTVSATAASCQGPFSGGGVTATMAVKAKDGTLLGQTAGTIGFTPGAAPTGSGVFAASLPVTNGDFTVPLSLSPAGTDPVVFLVEGRASAGFSAGFGMQTSSNKPSCGSGSVSVTFHANNPAAITLSDGTTLASHGVRYAAWPGKYAN